MRWLLTVLVLCLAAVAAYSYQLLGMGVDLGADRPRVEQSALSGFDGARLTAVSYGGELVGGRDVPVARMPPATTPLRLDGAAAREALTALRAHIDRPALESLAERLAGRVDRHPEDADALLVLCEASRLLGRVDAAESFAAAAVERFPHLSRSHLERARALAERMKRAGMLGAIRFLGDFKQALGKALELDPADVEARCDRIGFLCFAPGLLGGDTELALDMARELGRDEPVRGVVMEAVALLADGRERDAVQRAREAVSAWRETLDPHDELMRQLHLVLAGTLVEVEAFDEAAAQFELAKAGPDDTVRFQALYMHAKLRCEEDFEHAQALADLETFLAAEPYGELMPFLGAAHWRAGQALEGLGRDRDALAAYDRAVAVDPDFDKAADAREALLARL